MKVQDLYKVDILSFNSKIGYITNLGTTFYEMQSMYEKGSREYEEINNRLKLCCIEQNRTIDAAKGLKTKDFPKHWTKYQQILDSDTPEEVARKEFENKLVIDKRPEFMKFLYSHYAKEYKTFRDDFDRYSMIMFGKKVEELTEEEKQLPDCADMIEYYEKKNPLLETNGVMNKLCRHMQKELKDTSHIFKQTNNDEILDILLNKEIPIDEQKLSLMVEKRKDYEYFKKSKQLKSSEFSTYEQYFKFLRNDCLEKISSDIKELANLAVYICYSDTTSKPKDFCWDVFGAGIIENIQTKRTKAQVPHIFENGQISYLGENYEFVEIDTRFVPEKVDFEDMDFANFDEEFEEFEDLEEL